MYDYENMNGYDFEVFIQNILDNLGFITLVTQKSNDGGIDVIAHYDKPFFKGKYLVQCKRYTNNNVGQPQIRDLYGTVMKERAIKGILITTSTFTTQALEFANEVGIECIDGRVLAAIVSETIGFKKSNIKIMSFSQNSPAYKLDNTYINLLNKIEIDSKSLEFQYKMIYFLYRYLRELNLKELYSGVLGEIQYYSTQYLTLYKKLSKKSKEDKKNDYQYIINVLISACIFNGEILKAYEIIKEQGVFEKPFIIYDSEFETKHISLIKEVKYNFYMFLKYNKVCEIEVLFNEAKTHSYFKKSYITHKSDEEIARLIKQTFSFVNGISKDCFLVLNKTIPIVEVFSYLKFKKESILNDIEKMKILFSEK